MVRGREEGQTNRAQRLQELTATYGSGGTTKGPWMNKSMVGRVERTGGSKGGICVLEG